MRVASGVILIGLLAGCGGSKGTAFVSQCPAGKSMAIAGQLICEGGDPAVVAALPAWAKPPVGVKITSTSIAPETNPTMIGYVGRFEGSLAELQPVFVAQLRAVPEMKPRNLHAKLFLARKDGDLAGSSVTLTEQSTTLGAKLVEVRVTYTL